MIATRARIEPSKFVFSKETSNRRTVSTKYVHGWSGISCHPNMPKSSYHSLSPHRVAAIHAASGKWSGCSHMYASFHNGSKYSRGLVSASKRRHAAISADMAITHTGDKMKLGTTTIGNFPH